MLWFYLTLPLKAVLIPLVGFYRIHQARIPFGNYVARPDFTVLYKDILRLRSLATDYIRPGKTLGASYVTRRTFSNIHGVGDHQAIRHGAMVWANPAPALITGSSNFIDKHGDFTRNDSGGGDVTTPIEAILGVCLGITQGPVSRKVRRHFIRAVVKLIRSNYVAFHTPHGKRRATATGVDAVFFGGVLAAAYLVTGRKIFKKIFTRKLFLEGWFLLFVAPLTYHAKNRRLYFIEYTCMVGYQLIIKAFQSKLAKIGMRFVSAQSYSSANPMFAALMKESGVTNQKFFDYVLHTNAHADLHSASFITEATSPASGKIDWSSVMRDEFLFDDFPSNRRVGNVVGFNPLNGLAYGKSLEILLK